MSNERLRSLVDPASTAVLTMELQRGVVGAQSRLAELVAAVEEAGVVPAAARVCDAARAAGARVVHCTAESRADGAGAAINCAMLAVVDRQRRESGATNEVGTEGAMVVPELGPDPRDLVVPRLHGMTPFTGTSLDQLLRNMGITTVVVTGVSLNVGVLGTCLSAVDLGYQVVVVRDAVAGMPADYAEAVMTHTIRVIATVTDAAELVAIWA